MVVRKRALATVVTPVWREHRRKTTIRAATAIQFRSAVAIQK
jgi:hypothetical protein